MGGTARDKSPDEVFCRSCGETIKKMAEICPNCGVENLAAPETNNSSGSTATAYEHDPSQYDTTVSETWWYGVAGGVGLWVLAFVLSNALGESLGLLGGFFGLIAWVGLPLAAYFDMKYIRANSKWNPNTILWVIGFVIPMLNIVGGGVYLYRRHEVLGTP